MLVGGPLRRRRLSFYPFLSNLCLLSLSMHLRFTWFSTLVYSFSGLYKHRSAGYSLEKPLRFCTQRWTGDVLVCVTWFTKICNTQTRSVPYPLLSHNGLSYWSRNLCALKEHYCRMGNKLFIKLISTHRDCLLPIHKKPVIEQKLSRVMEHLERLDCVKSELTFSCIRMRLGWSLFLVFGNQNLQSVLRTSWQSDANISLMTPWQPIPACNFSVPVL